MKLFTVIAIAILSSLLLLGGCGDQLPTDIPDPYEYDGFIELGWEAYGNNNYESAMEYFEDAIDCDVSCIEGYLGAGWTALFLSDYWRIADNFFYMAIQHDAGSYPLMAINETQVQDTMWTTFECLHPDLPYSVLDTILAQTDSMGAIWVGDQIYSIINNADIPYRFVVEETSMDLLTMFKIENGFSGVVPPVDSIVEDAGDIWVYVTVPYNRIKVGDDYYRTWINCDNTISYDYETFTASGTETQFSYDVLVGTTMLQSIRGEYGYPLLGVAAALGVDALDSDYVFGDGKGYAGLEVISNVNIKGTAAALAFEAHSFNYAWFICKTEGYGLDLDPKDPTFITDLLLVIQDMLQ